jgi:hypothetical protein
MDPFLEAEPLWPRFRHQLVVTLAQTLSPGLSARYAVHTAERRFDDASGACAEEYLCIGEVAGGRPVTVLDLVGPAAKQTDAGREAYLATRRESLGAGASFVEIDLVLGGRPTLEYGRDGLPQWDYAVTVSRATLPEQYEIYTSTLVKRLPRFKLPLAADDRDTVVDLQAAVVRAYDACDFGDRIDYGREAGLPWDDDVRARVAEVLRDRLERPGPKAPSPPS